MSSHFALVRWQRNSPEFVSGKYSREHTWEFDGGVVVPASPSPHVVPAPWSNPENVDPEEAFVASVASCHLLTFLWLASKAGFSVARYVDRAEGRLARNEAGRLWVSEITLRPDIGWEGARRPSAEEIERLHEAAHAECFIANSVRTEVRVEAPAGSSLPAEPVSLRVIDAFTDRAFSGNPAAVCRTAGPMDETWMKALAREMNLSETAFVHPIDGGFSLRWFTPAVEVRLCGHATLATAHALWSDGVVPKGEAARFLTKSGWLTCRQEDGWIEMDFPAQRSEPVVAVPDGLLESLGVEAVALARTPDDYLVELADEETVRAVRPDFTRLKSVDTRGVIVTARASHKGFDVVSRFFAPAAGIDEDPVTGSAHCALGPYWQAKLARSEFAAFQASERGGVVHVKVRDDRVVLRGKAVAVSRVLLAGDLLARL
jgi:PhzF family phenazine biosynthesis protein